MLENCLDFPLLLLLVVVVLLLLLMVVLLLLRCVICAVAGLLPSQAGAGE
jgi:hypothetical protein